MKKFRIYDNNGRTFDRYTLVIRENDSHVLHFWGSSENPFHPQGFGQYCGSSDDGIHAGAHLGKKVKTWESLPENVLAFFAQNVRACGWDYHKENAKENLS